MERPLPSYGLLPFFRAFICELDYSCYNRSIDNNYDEAFYELIKKLNNNLNDLISISTSEVSTLLSELFMLNQAIRINSSQISSIQKRNITQVQDITLIVFISNYILFSALNSSLICFQITKL